MNRMITLALFAALALAAAPAVKAQMDETAGPPPMDEMAASDDAGAPGEMGDEMPAAPQPDEAGPLQGGPKGPGAKGMAGHNCPMQGKMAGAPMGKQGMMKSFSGKDVKALDEEILSSVKEYDAEFAAKLETLLKEKPFVARMAVGKAGQLLKFAKEKGDKDFAQKIIRGLKLDLECQELAKSYKDSNSDSEKAKLKQQLEAKLGESFDLRLAGEEKRVADLSKKVDELKTRIAKRKAKKSDLVKDRLQELTTEKERW